MAIVESVGKTNVQGRREKAKYQVTLLRGRRSGSHIEILEIIEAEDAEDAVRISIEISNKAKWHIEKIERMLT